MRVLLDECVDRRLAPLIPGHEVRTVRGERWSGLPDRRILERAAASFDILVTTDPSLPFQQNLRAFELEVVVIVQRQPGFEGLRAMVPELLDVLSDADRPKLTWIPPRD